MAAASKRVKVFEIGPTDEGRQCLVTVIGDAHHGPRSTRPAPSWRLRFRVPHTPSSTAIQMPVRWASGPRLQVSGAEARAWTLARFPGNDRSVLSGLMRGVAETCNRPAILDVPVGQGRVAMFATNAGEFHSALSRAIPNPRRQDRRVRGTDRERLGAAIVAHSEDGIVSAPPDTRSLDDRRVGSFWGTLVFGTPTVTETAVTADRDRMTRITRSVKTRLVATFAITTALSLASAALCIGTVRDLDNVIAKRLAGSKARTDQMTDMLVGVAVMRSELRGLILSEYERLQHVDTSNQFEKSEQTFRTKAASVLTICDQYRAATQEGLSEIDSIKAGIGDWLKLFDEVVAIANQGRPDEARILAATKLRPIMVAIEGSAQSLVDTNRRRYAEGMADAARSTARAVWLSALFCTAVLAACGAGLIVSLRIARQLRTVAERIATGCAEVDSAAAQLSRSGQALAQASTEQAASLEETSSSADGISALSRQNLELCVNAGRLFEVNALKLAAVTELLGKMSQSMADTDKSGQKVSGIIKIIDSIAFQTNILALNAAVEAARAGEAGMGFAVVADEVRTLAQRCASAAHDTTELIEQSRAASSHGQTDVTNVASAVLAVNQTSSEVASLAAGVAAGSTKQATGVEQIAQAISQFEKVTQSIAASAEESAAASTELSGQAGALNRIVDELAVMAGWQRGNSHAF